MGIQFLLGRNETKDLLIHLLNTLLQREEQIIDLLYNPVECRGPSPDSRTAIFDLRCTAENGEVFIIEMQQDRRRFFKDRAAFYTAMLITDLAERGQQWDFCLPEIYFIGITDFGFDKDNPDKFLHRVSLRDDNAPHYTIAYPKLEFTFLEIPKFRKGQQEVKTGLDKWCYLLKNLGRLEEIPVFLNTQPFEKLFSLAEISNLTKEEYQMYNRALLDEQDKFALLKYEWQKGELAGRRKGIQEGRQEGIKEGIQKGIQKARREGRKKEREEILRMVVKNCMKTGELSIAQIASITEQSEEYILHLRESMKS